MSKIKKKKKKKRKDKLFLAFNYHQQFQALVHLFRQKASLCKLVSSLHRNVSG